MVASHMVQVKLVVKDPYGVELVEDDVNGSANGEQLFNRMNSMCEFAKWTRADTEGPDVNFTVMNSRDS